MNRSIADADSVEADRESKQQLYLQRVRDRYPDIEAKSISLVTGGHYNDILVLDETLVFRFPRSADGLKHLQFEMALLQTFHDHVSLPIPQPRFCGEDMQTVGLAFMGYHRLPGKPLADRLDRFKASATCQDLASQLATFIRELHAVPVGIPAVRLPIRDMYRREALPGICEQVREHICPQMGTEGRAWVSHFEAFIHDPSTFSYEPVIRHGDLGPHNILVDDATLRISGILDFGSAGLDDPATDVAFVSFWGEAFLGSKDFVRRLYESYPVTEELLRRIQFYRVMIPLSLALAALQAQDRETFLSMVGKAEALLA